MSAKVQKIVQFFKIVRINNLLIIALAQWLTARFLIPFSVYEQASIFQIILSSVLLVLSGFLFNDLMDLKTDSANNKLNGFIFLGTSKLKYLGIITFLFSLALLLAWITTSVFFWLQVFTLLFILLYSVFIKKIIFLKNIYVSLLTAWAIAIFIFIHDSYDPFAWLFVFFAFWLNMIREAVKDMQDKKGDTFAGISTIPVVLGDVFSWNYLITLTAILFVSEILCIHYLWEFFGFRIYFLMLVFTPSFLLLSFILRFRMTENKLVWFNHITKGLMITGMISMIFL